MGDDAVAFDIALARAQLLLTEVQAEVAEVTRLAGVQWDAAAELAEFRAECDKVGVPYDAAGLVRHHRGNAGLAAEANVLSAVLTAERERDAARAEVERLTAEARDWENAAQAARGHYEQSDARLAVAASEIERLTAEGNAGREKWMAALDLNAANRDRADEALAKVRDAGVQALTDAANEIDAPVTAIYASEFERQTWQIARQEIADEVRAIAARRAARLANEGKPVPGGWQEFTGEAETLRAEAAKIELDPEASGDWHE